MREASTDWRKYPKRYSRAEMAACRVSYVDLEGFRHSVEIEAGSLYEAAVLAVSTFRQHHFEPGDLTNLEVEIRTAITHTVTLRKVRSWLEGGSRSPKEAIVKDRLRALL
jgi:hypothetical protein